MGTQLELFPLKGVTDADLFVTLCDRIASGTELVAKYAHLLDDRPCRGMLNQLLKYGFTKEDFNGIIDFDTIIGDFSKE